VLPLRLVCENIVKTPIFLSIHRIKNYQKNNCSGFIDVIKIETQIVKTGYVFTPQPPTGVPWGFSSHDTRRQSGMARPDIILTRIASRNPKTGYNHLCRGVFISRFYMLPFNCTSETMP
jgi:hypothetical protein